MGLSWIWRLKGWKWKAALNPKEISKDSINGSDNERFWSLLKTHETKKKKIYPEHPVLQTSIGDESEKLHVMWQNKLGANMDIKSNLGPCSVWSCQGKMSEIASLSPMACSRRKKNLRIMTNEFVLLSLLLTHNWI